MLKYTENNNDGDEEKTNSNGDKNERET